VALSNVTKNPRVTVRSVTALGATVALSTNGANGFTFENLTINGWNLSGSTTRNITVQGSRFIDQAYLNLCGIAGANILIDNSTFIDINVAPSDPEGRLHVAQPGCLGTQSVGVTVSNSTFENTGSGTVGESDGIQVGAYGVVIGPGNTFRGIRQGNFSRHVDALQMYGQSHTTVKGNYFVNCDTNVMAPDGGNTEIFTDNVFDISAPGAANPFQLANHNGDQITHNTFSRSTGPAFDVDITHKSLGDPPSSNVLFRDNIIRGGKVDLDCTNCTITHNMFASGAVGTNNIIGSPTFVGGSNPATWPGFQLAAGSVGKGAATDGADMGTTGLGGVSSPPPPGAPANLRVIK
jgi:hypothetical protein